MLLSEDVDMLKLALILIRNWESDRVIGMLQSEYGIFINNEGIHPEVYSYRLNNRFEGDGIILFNEKMGWSLHKHAYHIVFAPKQCVFYEELTTLKWEIKLYGD